MLEGFGRMPGESKNGGGMRDKNTSAGTGFVHCDRRDVGYFLIYGEMRDEKQKITGYGCHVENCDLLKPVGIGKNILSRTIWRN